MRKLGCTIYIIIVIVICFTNEGIAQNDLFTVESNNRGVLFSTMSVSERDNISSPAEGLIIFNKDNGKLEFFNGTTWEMMKMAGPIGIAGTLGPTGQPGPDGPQGPPGDDGLRCWDLDEDDFKDSSEDINGDGIWDRNDCLGATGPQGLSGLQGPNGAPGIAGGTVISVLIATAGQSCIEIPSPLLVGLEDAVLIHGPRQDPALNGGGVLAMPRTYLNYNLANQTWNICASSGTLTVNTYYDVLVVGSN